MKRYCIIFKSQEFNSTELHKDDTVHVFWFMLPVYLHHRTQCFHLLSSQLQCIWLIVPALKKRWSNMFPDKLIASLNIQHFLIRQIKQIVTCWCVFLFLLSLLLNVIFVEFLACLGIESAGKIELGVGLGELLWFWSDFPHGIILVYLNWRILLAYKS
jgi:hypothetical protein